MVTYSFFHLLCRITHISVASFLVLGGGGGKTPKFTERKQNNVYEYAPASERLRNIYIFRSHNTSVYIYNQCSSLLLLVVWRYKQQHTNKTLTLRKSMYMRASLEHFRIFTFYNFYFLQYFVGTSDTLSQEHNIFRSQNTFAYTYNQCSSLLLLVVWGNYVYASERA